MGAVHDRMGGGGGRGIWLDGYRGSIVTVVGQWEHREKVYAIGG